MSSNNIQKSKKLSVNPEKVNQAVDYRFLIIIIIVAIFSGVIYMNSKKYLVKKTLKGLQLIENYSKIKNYDDDESITLKELTIASTFNPVNRLRASFDYQSEEILKSILRCGARYIELNIFAKNFNYGSKPIISCGIKSGQWKLMFNELSFEKCIQIIKENAFNLLTDRNGSPNNEDPLFLGLNLYTGYNIETLDIVADIIIEYMADYLLEPQYSYQYEENFQDMKFSDLKGKLVILSSDGFEGSKLEEIINASWVDETNINMNEAFINYYSDVKESFNDIENTSNLYDSLVNDTLNKKKILRISAATINKYGFNKEYLINHNKNGLTIVVPNVDGDIKPKSFNPQIAWDLGCQFVCMNYQNISSRANDVNLDKYISHFRDQAFVPL